MKNRVSKSAKKLFDARDDIIDLFEKGTFPYKGNEFKTKEKEQPEESEEKLDENKIFKDIENESEGINYRLFAEHFKFVVPSSSAKELFATKDKKKNNKLVNVIKSRLIDLKNEIEKMSKDKIETEKPNKIVNIVKFNQEKD